MLSLNNGVTRLVEGPHHLSSNVVRKGADLFDKGGIGPADTLRNDFHDFVILGHQQSVGGTEIPRCPRATGGGRDDSDGQ